MNKNNPDWESVEFSLEKLLKKYDTGFRSTRKNTRLQRDAQSDHYVGEAKHAGERMGLPPKQISVKQEHLDKIVEHGKSLSKEPIFAFQIGDNQPWFAVPKNVMEQFMESANSDASITMDIGRILAELEGIDIQIRKLDTPLVYSRTRVSDRLRTVIDRIKGRN